MKKNVIETAARALYVADQGVNGFRDTEWEDLTPVVRASWEQMAQAVLASLWEHQDEVVELVGWARQTPIITDADAASVVMTYVAGPEPKKHY